MVKQYKKLSCYCHPENPFKFTNCSNTFNRKTVPSQDNASLLVAWFFYFVLFCFFSSLNLDDFRRSWSSQHPIYFRRLQAGLIFLSEFSSISLPGVFSWLDFKICIFGNKVINRRSCISYCTQWGGLWNPFVSTVEMLTVIIWKVICYRYLCHNIAFHFLYNYYRCK